MTPALITPHAPFRCLTCGASIDASAPFANQPETRRPKYGQEG